MSFTGFSDEGVALLSALPGYDKAGFAADKERYQALIMDPARALVADLAERLAGEISPGIIGQPKVNGSISPINRDLRFDPGGAPYKDHLLLRWWEGPTKKTAPTLMVRISPTDVGFASGVVFASTDGWRRVVGDPARARELVAVIDAVAAATPDLDVAGADLKRVPAGYDADHPGADLLRHKATLQLRWPEPVDGSIHGAGFVDACAERLGRFAALHRWLVAHPT